MRRLTQGLLFLLLGSTMTIACADTPPPYYESPLPVLPSAAPAAGLHFTLQGGFQFGGTELARVTVEDVYGNDYSNRVRAGGLINIGAGATLQFLNSPVSLSATINWAGDFASEDNVDVSLTRTPLEFMVHYQQGLQRWGLGVTNHTDIEFEATVDSTINPVDDHVTYKDAVGPMVEWSYQLAPPFWFVTRYTYLRYKPDRYNGTDVSDDGQVNASHVSLMLRGIF